MTFIYWCVTCRKVTQLCFRKSEIGIPLDNFATFVLKLNLCCCFLLHLFLLNFCWYIPGVYFLFWNLKFVKKIIELTLSFDWFFSNTGKSERMLLCFGLKTNLKTILSTKELPQVILNETFCKYLLLKKIFFLFLPKTIRLPQEWKKRCNNITELPESHLWTILSFLCRLIKCNQKYEKRKG